MSSLEKLKTLPKEDKLKVLKHLFYLKDNGWIVDKLIQLVEQEVQNG